MINIFLKIPIFRKIIFILADCQNFILSLAISSWFLKYNLDLREIYSYTLPVAIVIFIFTGQYKGLSRYVGSPDLYKISLRNLFLFLYQTFIFNQKLTHSFLKLLLLNFIIYTILVFTYFYLNSR